MIVTLPWPDKRVFPNAKRRTHWRTYQPVIKAERELARLATMAATARLEREGLAASTGKIPLTVTFYPPDRRKRDDDGMVSAFKHMRDGIADALGLDDHRFRPHYFFEDPCKPGRVEVRFIGDSDGDKFSPETTAHALKENGPDKCGNTPSGPEHQTQGAR